MKPGKKLRPAVEHTEFLVRPVMSDAGPAATSAAGGPGDHPAASLRYSGREPLHRHHPHHLHRVTAGILLVLNTVGTERSRLQWLVAALGVGIGFGLQEIVANFISGLIILFERPVRVGDVVTVGDTDGV